MLRNEVITSRSNPLVKWVSSLLDKKGRAKSESFLVDGIKLSLEAINAGLPVTHVLISEDKVDTYLDEVMTALRESSLLEVEVSVLSVGAFEKISSEKAPQGVISVIKYLDFFSINSIIYKEDFFLGQNERAIMLCSVRDPSNLGAVIRSAVAFGTEHIVLSADCADLYNPKTLRSAMGSLFRIKATVVSSPEDFIAAAKENGRRIFAAELKEGARSLTELGLTSSDIVIIGNEGHGIPGNVSALCNGSVYIPISDRTESLNASVAAAVFMWEQSKNV